ncbi:MAG: Ig-like domain-containing protein [Saprospiraceae bacterium]|nr:Ig-like domain-containing protein [Saprospiraceae bacterium]
MSISGPTDICVGGVSNLLPSTGGTWNSSHPMIASVTNGGVVTGLVAGTASFVFTHAVTGCTSFPTPLITVYAKPIISITNSSVCVGNTAQLMPSFGGKWISSNSAVATVNNSGMVMGIADGSAQFTFVQNTDQAVHPIQVQIVNVLPKPIISVTGPNNICPGQTTNSVQQVGEHGSANILESLLSPIPDWLRPFQEERQGLYLPQLFRLSIDPWRPDHNQRKTKYFYIRSRYPFVSERLPN